MLNQTTLQALVDSFEGRTIPPYVLAATLATELNSTKQTAKQLSLCSKNAQAITARADEWGKGFSGITDYINVTANIMISLADSVGELAQGLTKASVKSVFEQKMAANLDRLSDKAFQNHPELHQLKEDILKSADQFTEKNLNAVVLLKKNLREIKDCNRTLNSIVAICRIEASRAGPFQDSLWAIADTIEDAVLRLKDRILMGDRLMNLME
ncbi:hypothetical protein BTA51_19040 [Hahella sp. CCB-MM4]|uniref:hypothetical protein n=1 Tax=Hahella sp. (strain CCB-MM4) TaxID=1926491 RepID=UPI000B9BDBB6|nr:hypothetical protein [Hahella sp. CCB-MM4]OZG71738.1 hypothetical protein BTA51_19040 [Hahella sp. CCB-MM4]